MEQATKEFELSQLGGASGRAISGRVGEEQWFTAPAAVDDFEHNHVWCIDPFLVFHKIILSIKSNVGKKIQYHDSK